MRNTAYEFATEVDWRIEALSESDYLEHDNQGKELLEEWYPLSRLALHLKQAGLEVKVEIFEDDGAADGHLQIIGFWDAEFDVQITCCFDYEEKLRRELLVTEGSAPGAGEIYRDRESGQIHATQGVRDYYEYIERVAEEVMERFHKKSEFAYRSDTALIIAFHEPKLGGLSSWKRLSSALEDEGGMGRSNFTSVYLFNSAINQIQRAA